MDIFVMCKKCYDMFNLSDLKPMETESTKFCSHCVQDAWDAINYDVCDGDCDHVQDAWDLINNEGIFAEM